MKIDLFKNIPVFKNILEKDNNNREINIYKTTNVCLTGHSIFYPNVLLSLQHHQNSILILDKQQDNHMCSFHHLSLQS